MVWMERPIGILRKEKLDKASRKRQKLRRTSGTQTEKGTEV
jgi:hypothetical protein